MTFDDLQQRTATHPHVAVYLTLPGWGPCQAVRPWLEALFDDPRWRWEAIDSSRYPHVGGQLLVFTHPTLLLFVDGREAGHFSRVLRRRDVEPAKLPFDTTD